MSFDFIKDGKLFDYVVTVCDEASGQRCPIFPGALKKINWSFEDPSALTGTEEEKLKKYLLLETALNLNLKNS